MAKDIKFTETKGLNEKVAISRITEMLNKYGLNDTEDQLIKESINFIENHLKELRPHIDRLEHFREFGLNKLSKKDLANYLKEELLTIK